MARRALTLASALAVAFGLVVAGCGSTPSGPQLTDPQEILTRSVQGLADAKTVHIKADIGGQLQLNLGQGSGSSLDLKGTTGEGDLDLVASKARISLKTPLLFGLTADAIAVDNALYLRTSMTGTRYTRTGGSAAGSGGASLDPKQAIAALRTQLDALPKPPVKLGDEQVDGHDCYHVQVGMPAAALAATLGPLGLPTTGMTDGTLDVWAAKDTLRPAKVRIRAGSTGTVTLDLTLTLSAYDQTVNISAPPADQVGSTP
jgi:hypothetical protein